MHVLTQCDHSHTARVSLGETEQFTIRARWAGGKDVVVTAVTATARPGREPERIRASGFYAKKDGTASSTRPAFPPEPPMSTLPALVCQALLQALEEVTCQ